MKTRFANQPPKAVILAAGVGSRIRPLTDDCPKCLLEVGGITILERMITGNLACGITEFVFVLGYLEDRIVQFVNRTFPDLNATFIVNEKFAKTNTGYSLMLVEPHCRETGFIKFDADVAFDQEILTKLIDDKHPNCLCIDRNIQLDAEEVKVIADADNRVIRASKSVPPASAIGESIGIEKISGATAPILFDELKAMMADPANMQEYYEGAYERLIAQGVAFQAVDITGLKWVEIDTVDDFSSANHIFKHLRVQSSGV